MRQAFIPLFSGLTGLMIVLQVVSHVALALHNPGDAQASEDERERALRLRATRPW